MLIPCLVIAVRKNADIYQEATRYYLRLIHRGWLRTFGKTMEIKYPKLHSVRPLAEIEDNIQQSLISRKLLQDFSSLNNSYYYSNKCNNKQNVNETSCMKCEESEQPSNYENHGNDIK